MVLVSEDEGSLLNLNFNLVKGMLARMSSRKTQVGTGRPGFPPILSAFPISIIGLAHHPAAILSEELAPYITEPRFLCNESSMRVYPNETYPTYKFVSDPCCRETPLC